MGSAQPITHKEKKHFCHWIFLDHVLSIKTFTDQKKKQQKKNCCVWLFVLDNKWRSLLYSAFHITWVKEHLEIYPYN